MFVIDLDEGIGHGLINSLNDTELGDITERKITTKFFLFFEGEGKGNGRGMLPRGRAHNNQDFLKMSTVF